jgi:type VI secretion system protein ImpJ
LATELEEALPPPAIDWHEGMLLAPQHFQLLSRRIDQLAAYRIADAAPFAWGVRRAQADPALLIDGVVRIEALEAVLADGTIVNLAADDLELRLALAGFPELERGQPLRIWLVLPTRHAGADGHDDDSRFRSVEGPLVWDETTGEGRMRMPVLRPRLRLLAVERPPRKYTSLPLFEVRRERDLIVLADYEPPRLAIGDAPALLAECRA